MNILPNQEELYMHPHAHVLLILMHHVLVYLERCVDEAPFGFVLDGINNVAFVDIPSDIDMQYSDYLHRVLSGSGGVLGVWMELNMEEIIHDVVRVEFYVKRELLPLSLIIPVRDSERWWVES